MMVNTICAVCCHIALWDIDASESYDHGFRGIIKDQLARGFATSPGSQPHKKKD
jgi:hypothetical protein